MATEQLTSGPRARLGTRLPRPPRWAAWAFDVLLIVVLTVIAYAVRHGGLPSDGLWFDDSWVAAGAIHGHLTNIMTVGSGQPGFTAVLMAWHHLGSGSLHSLALPALTMGTITPAVLYLSLRSFGYRRSICALLASIAVVAGIDILYSGRVKPYTFDPVLVLCIGVAIPWLARRTWRWPLAIGWTITALALGSFSGYVLVATAAAGIILFLHPAGDRLVRGCAVAAQAAGQLVFYIWAQRSTDLTGIEDVLRTSYDAHLHFYANPIRFGSEILTHVARIAWIYPGGGGAWLKVGGVLAVAGLIIASVKSDRRNELLPARYLGLMLVLAFVGALAGKFPFGPTYDNFLSSGSRYNLWTLPAMAVGLAALLQRARDLVRGHEILARVFDAAVVAIADRGPRRGLPLPGRLPLPRIGHRHPLHRPSPRKVGCGVDHLERLRVRRQHPPPGQAPPEPHPPGRLHSPVRRPSHPQPRPVGRGPPDAADHPPGGGHGRRASSSWAARSSVRPPPRPSAQAARSRRLHRHHPQVRVERRDRPAEVTTVAPT